MHHPTISKTTDAARAGGPHTRGTTGAKRATSLVRLRRGSACGLLGGALLGLCSCVANVESSANTSPAYTGRSGGTSGDAGADAAAVGGPVTVGDSGQAQNAPSDGGDPIHGGDPSSADADVPLGGGGDPSARAVAAKLGRSHFLMGLGNDLNSDHDQDGAYTLGATLDLHYAYLVGLGGRGGWPDWNTGGQFVNILTDSAKRHGTVPMFTVYAMAASGENNVSVLTDEAYMAAYWTDMKLLFQRLGAFGDAAVVHLEPDFWAYVQHASQGDPSAVRVIVKKYASDCASQTDDLAGLGKCLLVLARKYAPKTLVGFHASSWADPDPSKVGAFLAKLGGGEADLVFMDMLDRDAGCFEAHTDPACQRGGTTGWYFDETNTLSPNFRETIASGKAVSDAVGRPLMWWQLPLGVPSNTPGGSAGRYRDNRVRYLFSHVAEFVAGGAVGAAFGTGAGNQTDITTDGGQFKRAVSAYYAAPYAL
jgi:hypothetical protein